MTQLRPIGAASLMVAAIAGASGCFNQYSPMQRVRDAAFDLNTATRFGRMDVALECVGTAWRDRFTRAHAAWGSGVRVLDRDIVGITLADKEHARVSVTCAWHRIDETDMRSTQIAQSWQSHRGSWRLEKEERASGDVGLLGEK